MIEVGDRFETNRGGWCRVVEYQNSKNIIIEFEDKHRHQVSVTGNQIKRGEIKNPYAPLLFGVGYNGVGKHKTKDGPAWKGFKNLPAYSAWINMLSRCYNKNYIDPHLYVKTEVQPEWHCFQAFAEWYYNELQFTGWEGKNYLDKDILGDGTLYSKTTCCLVPASLNSAVRQNGNGKYLFGVRGEFPKGWRILPNYPSSDLFFESEKQAHIAFLKEKEVKIHNLAMEFKKYLRPDVYFKLINFRFDSN